MTKFKPPTTDEINTVFDRWNIYKGRGNWKGHRELTYEAEVAIKDVLKHYKVSQICEAIDNYALILLGKEYKWSYAWTLYQFLIRNKPDNRQERQFWRFLDNNFLADDYLTERAKTNKRIRETFWECPKCKKAVPSIKLHCPYCNTYKKTNEMITADKVMTERKKLLNNFGKF